METIDVDAEGDVVLVCGKEGERLRLRVYSGLLTRASPVFEALLSPRLKETTEFLSSGALEITLPDDDGAALKTICYFLHFRNDQADYELSLKEVVKVGLLVDKYDLAGAVKPIAEVWIRRLRERGTEDRRETLLMAAYLLQHGPMFEAVSEELIWKGTSVTIDLPEDERSQVPGQLKKFFGALENARRFAVGSAADSILEIIEKAAPLAEDCASSCSPTCVYAEKRLRWVVTHLRTMNLWPVRYLEDRPLDKLLQSMENSELRKGDELVGMSAMPFCVIKCDYRQDGKFFGDKDCVLHARAQAIRASTVRVCYSCVREGTPLSRPCAHKEIQG